MSHAQIEQDNVGAVAGLPRHGNRGNGDRYCQPTREKRIPMKTLNSFGSIALMLTLVGATQPATAADVTKGAQLYSTHCATCHGLKGVPVMPGSPNFARSEGLLQADLSLLGAIRAGKNAMPGYLGILRDAEILDVIAYLRTLRQ